MTSDYYQNAERKTDDAVFINLYELHSVQVKQRHKETVLGLTEKTSLGDQKKYYQTFFR